MSKAPETIKLEQKMKHKSYRFIWFARTSWGYMQGQRLSALRRFWGARRRFDRQCIEDMER